MKFPSSLSFGVKKVRLPKLHLPFGRGPKKPLHGVSGIDVGSHSVKWVEIQDSGRPELSHLSIVPVDGRHGREAVVTAIKEAVERSGSTTRHVQSAISGHSVIIRYVQFPKMTREELTSHIEVEADKYIPFNVKDVVLDCHILEEKKEEGKVHALVVAAKKDVVHQHLSLLEAASLEVVRLDVDTFAIVNAFENFLGALPPKVHHAVLDIGAKTTNLSILREATSLFSRDIPIGGTDFTKAVSEKLDLEMDAAEMLKCSGEKTREELLSLVEGPLEQLMGEIKLSFDYFENQHNKRIERIYLSGGSSRLPGLLEVTQKSFNIETTSWDPLAGIAVPSKEVLSKVRMNREALAVAIGLVLRKGHRDQTGSSSA